MASSDNLASLESWNTCFSSILRPQSNNLLPSECNSWNFTDVYNFDTDSLITRALQKSLSNTINNFSPETNNDSFITNFNDSTTTTETPLLVAPATPTASTVSGSDPEIGLKKRVVGGPKGKVSKRKSRAGKRSQTTFIMADPANFREMVQQVTGVRFGDMDVPATVVPVMKPEAQRVGGVGRLVGSVNGGGFGGCLLPTLDTSAFLLDHHRQQENMVVGSGSGSLADTLSLPVADGGLGFNGFTGFPTLESWKV